MTSTNSSSNGLIGLNVGGKKFYTLKSTLANAEGSYFASRFGGPMPPGAELPFDEEMACKVYFIDRDPHLFKYILAFLINAQRELPNNFPSYKDAPVLWKDLKREADFFCLEGMKLILREQAFIHSCSPDLGDKDILYWLGTRQGKADNRTRLKFGLYLLEAGSTISPYYAHQRATLCD